MDLDLLRTRLGVVLKEHDEVDLALVFGSRARAEAGPNSDVDVAVTGRGGDVIGLAVELTDAVGLRSEP
jgi:predicted nucleotidyltransferase